LNAEVLLENKLNGTLMSEGPVVSGINRGRSCALTKTKRQIEPQGGGRTDGLDQQTSQAARKSATNRTRRKKKDLDLPDWVQN
jgi:hypothetical protein